MENKKPGRPKVTPKTSLGKTACSKLDQAIPSGMISQATRSKYTLIICRFEEFVCALTGKENPRPRDVPEDMIIQYVEFRRQTSVCENTVRDEISALNTIFKLIYGRKKIWLSAKKDIEFLDRDHIARVSRAISEEMFEEILSRSDHEIGTIMRLQRQFGLRLRESILLDAKAARRQAKVKGEINIIYGTKGGRKRSVLITQPSQLDVLEEAVKLQRGKRSFIPVGKKMITFSQKIYREVALATKDLKAAGLIVTGTLFHGNRHYYAHTEYKRLTGVECVVKSGVLRAAHLQYMANTLKISPEEAKALDHKARMHITNQLGHGRKEVTNAYLG